ncbi:MAG: hypothetical protein KDB23_09710, partial [Planctomycetales bacterium]|nr:hypothetical protein [Planctomycetales bacterium]
MVAVKWTATRIDATQIGDGMAFDYLAWLDRAESFISMLARSGRGFSVQQHREGPANPHAIDTLAQSLPKGLPRSLEGFLATATKKCEIRFRWKPSESQLESIGDLTPHTYTFYGGPAFFNLDWMHTYDPNRSSWVDEVSDATLSPLVGLSPFGSVDDALIRITDPTQPSHDEEVRMWKGSLPISDSGIGDCLAVDLEVGNYDDPPVNYLSHELRGYSTQISSTFTSFLGDWEAISYLDWNICRFEL